MNLEKHLVNFIKQIHEEKRLGDKRAEQLYKKTGGELTQGSVLFVDGNGNLAEDNANLFWDNTAKKLKTKGLLISDLTLGSVPFIGADGLISQDNSNLFWDNGNKRLGIGMNNPDRPLHVMGQIKLEHATTAPCLTLKSGYDDHYGYIEWRKSTNNQRGAYLGWGTPGTYFGLHLEDVNYFSVYGGCVGINSAVNSKMSLGLTINQGAYDNEILAFKSSDIAHGITSYTETNTYAAFGKIGSTSGGYLIRGYGEDKWGSWLEGIATTDSTVKNATAYAPVVLRASKKSGTTAGVMGADANLLVVQNYSATRFIVDEDGDILYDGTANPYQEHDDIELIKELEDMLSEKIKEKDKKDKRIYKEKIVHEDNFISTKKKNMLLYGAIRQLSEKILGLESRLKLLEA